MVGGCVSKMQISTGYCNTIHQMKATVFLHLLIYFTGRSHLYYGKRVIITDILTFIFEHRYLA